MNVDKLQERLEIIVGIPKDDIKVDLCQLDGTLVAHLDTPTKLLKEYYNFDGSIQMLLKIVSDKKSVLEDFSISKDDYNITEDNIESRYKLTDEEYERREDTLRKFKQKYSLNNQQYNQSQKSNTETIIKRFYVGQRCIVKSPGKHDRYGTIRYIGITDPPDGYRIGVEFDHYLGIHDGIINGQYFFKCESKKGSYILPEFVFPLESHEDKLNLPNQGDLDEF